MMTIMGLIWWRSIGSVFFGYGGVIWFSSHSIYDCEQLGNSIIDRAGCRRFCIFLFFSPSSFLCTFIFLRQLLVWSFSTAVFLCLGLLLLHTGRGFFTHLGVLQSIIPLAMLVMSDLFLLFGGCFLRFCSLGIRDIFFNCVPFFNLLPCSRSTLLRRYPDSHFYSCAF